MHLSTERTKRVNCPTQTNWSHVWFEPVSHTIHHTKLKQHQQISSMLLPSAGEVDQLGESAYIQYNFTLSLFYLFHFYNFLCLHLRSAKD